MFKDYNKGLYKALFGDECYHSYGYGFTEGLNDANPIINTFINLGVTTAATTIGLVLGGSFVGFVTSLLTLLIVHCIYEDIVAFISAYDAKNKVNLAEQEAPLPTTDSVSIFHDKNICEFTGYNTGNALGNDINLMCCT